MNKILSCVLMGTFLAGGLASCSQEEPNVGYRGESTVRFNLNAPEDMATRADFGTGNKAVNLQYAAYPKGGTTPVVTGTAVMEGLSTTVEMQLAGGVSYNLLFWADAGEDGPYTVDLSTATVKADYAKKLNNPEEGDAFYVVRNDFTPDAEQMNETVTLTRPVAQLNFGTSDLNNLTVTQTYGNPPVVYSDMQLTACTGMNLLTGESLGSAEVVTAVQQNPTDEAFPASQYDYVAMNYILVPGDVDMVSLKWWAYSEAPAEDAQAGVGAKMSQSVSNVPLRPNYRTNIVGALLTSREGVSVVINPNFGTSSAWDGKTVTVPEPDAAGNYVVTRASDLAGIAQLANDADNTQDFAGKTIRLNTDIDLAGFEWTPIGNTVKRSGSSLEGDNSFKGTFDGGGHVIHNLKISKATVEKGNVVGFIGAVSGGTVKNISFSNIEVSNTKSEQCGGVVGIVANGGSLANVHVLSGNVNGTEGVGGIAGRILIQGDLTNCSNAATVTGTAHNVGGIVGAAYYTEEGKTINISSCRNTGAISGNSSTGGIVGYSMGVVDNCVNEGNVTATSGGASGGIVGQVRSCGSVTNSINHGDIANTGETGNGGIVGWINYISGMSVVEVIEVSGNTNYGSVKGGASSAGIVGLVYDYGVVKNNSSFAKEISAKTFASGIANVQNLNEGITIPSDAPDNEKENVIVSYNLSTTPLTAITGGSKAQFVYINTPAKTTAENNTDKQEVFDSYEKN